MIKIKILKSEYFKLKKSYIMYFYIGKLVLEILFSILFLNFYKNMVFNERIEFLIGIIFVIMPIFISIVSSLAIEQEKNANKFQNIILNKNYIAIYFCKILINYILFFIFNLILWGIIGIINYSYISYFIFIGLMSSVFSIYLFLIHFFINLILNYNFSLIFAIFDSILIIFATNGVFNKIWNFLPSLYGYQLIQNIFFSHNILINLIFLIGINLYAIKKIKC